MFRSNTAFRGEQFRSANHYYGKIYLLIFYISCFFISLMFFYADLYICLLYSGIVVIFLGLAFVVFRKITSIFIKMQFLLFFTGYVLSFPVMFIQKENFSPSGWRGIGNYDFGFSKTLQVYIVIIAYVATFVLIAFLLNGVIKNNYMLRKIVKKSRISLKLKLSAWKPVFALLLLFQLYLSYYMFQHKIGILGITPPELPYKLSGVLYYYRFLVVPLISFILLFWCGQSFSKWIILLVLIEAIVSGFFAASRAMIIMHAFPAVAYLFYSGYKKASYLVSIIIAFGFILITICRNFLYQLNEFSRVGFFDLLRYSFSHANITLDYFLSNISGIFMEATGLKEFLATYYNSNSYDLGVNWFLTKVTGFFFLPEPKFNIAENIFHLYLPKGFSFGVALTALADLYLATSGSFSIQSISLTLFMLTVWVLMLLLAEKAFSIVFLKYKHSPEYVIALSFYAGFLLATRKVTVFYSLPFLLLLGKWLFTLFCQNSSRVYNLPFKS